MSVQRTLPSHSQHTQLPQRPASLSAAAAQYQVKSCSVPSTPTHHNHRMLTFSNRTPTHHNHLVLTPSNRTPTSSNRMPTLQMRGDERPTGQDLKSTAEQRAGPGAGMMAQSPVSYRTMYVCNIGECNRGFAYKKNLVTHQRSKHAV